MFNFGDLDQYIDYDKSYVVGRDGETKYDLKPFNDRKERLLDIGRATGDRTNQRKNLPINLVLKEGLRTKDLGDRNYIVQMRITNGDDAKKIYAYAPGKSSMDYSSYTKSTSVSLSDKVDSLFVKGGQQSDSENATNQEFFMSEFIANPEEYADTTNIGIIRTQYMGQRSGGDKSPTVGGEQIAFVQVFDAKLVPFLKEEADGTIAYTNLLKNDRSVSKFAHKIKIKKADINYSKDGKLAYIVLAPKAFQKDDVKKVEITDHDQYTMLKGFYFTSIDYLVDKTKFADNFGGTNKLDYSMMSGWMNPNINGWTVFEKEYENNYKVPEGESYLIDVGTKPESNQIMIQIGDETRALYRKPQGYYNGYVTGKNGIDQIDEFAKGVYKFTLREGATIEKGQKIRILVPYVGDHPDTVNFLEANDGTDYNKGSAQLRLQKDRNINMHLYTDLPRGASFVLRYTLKGETEEKSLKLETPKVGTLWQYKDTDKVLTGLPNRSILSTGGNFYIDTTKLEPGKDIFVDAYDEKGNKLEDKTSYFRYSKVNKVSVHKDMTWVDHSDTSSILSINKSLYTPYQLLFTNDYAEGTDDFYKDPRAFTGTNENFMKDTKEFVGYTKYDGGKVRTLYEEGKVGKLYAKVEAAADEYTDKGEIKTDNSKKITIPKDHIFDAQFDGENKEYRAYEYKVYLTKMLPYHSEDKTEKSLTLLKDMKFVSNASDGSSLPSDLYETRVRARVLFDANTGKLTEGDKQVDKTVKIVPDNTKFYGEDGYAANGFEGANVEANTGDKFPEAPTHEGKNFLGWVTEAGKTALGNKAVVTADAFAKLSKDQIFTNETPVTKHLVVYAIYSDETAVTFDANQGKFTDGKDTTTVKVESGSVTKPADPTREGYEFKGWADKKDATAPTEGILDNVTAPKTVYAVWEKKADAELTLKNPTPVEVKDLKSLTSDEKDKVADAVIAANNTLGLAKADITVADDGTVTVKTKDGKTGTLASEKTVKQKEVQNNFNPPKEPVKVDNAKALTEDEIKQVKQAIKDANPERNFKDDEITVKPDGTVEINQAGKVGSFTPDQTVVQKDTILDLTAPEKTEVKDTTDLTQDERNKVAAAVKKANEGKLSAAAVVTVDNKGNVKVTDGTKTGKLEGKDTVKPFTRDGKKLNPPTQKVKVGDTNNLNETEKQAVKDAVKAANPELGFTDDEIQVDPNGTVTVPMGKSEASIPGTETVEEATDADKIIKLVAPAKTEVADKSHLTDDEKNAVIAAIKEANPSLKSEGYNIVVSDDGAVTVTQGTGDNQKVGQLSQADTVVEKLKAPKAPVGVKNPSNLTPEEKTAVEDAVKDANPNLPKDAKITVGNDGTVTVTDKDGKEIGTITADKTVKKAGAIVAPAEPVKVKDPSKLTDDEKKAVEDAVKKANPDLPLNATIEVGNDGTVTVTDKDGKELGKLTPAQTVKKADEAGTVVAPAEPVKVADPSNLTEPEKKAVEDAVKKANPNLPEGATIEVGKDGTVTVKDKDGKELGKLKPEETVKAALKAPTEPVSVKDPSKLTDEEKKAVEKAVKDANPTLPADAKVTVGEDGTVTVTDKDGKELGKLTPDKTVKKADEAGTVVAPAEPVKVADPSNLTEPEKKAVEDAVKKANPNLPEGATIEVGKDGTVTVKDKDGKELGKLKPEETVKAALKAPTEPVSVKDPSKLTDEEKKAVEKAVKDANPTLPADAKVTVGEDGTVTVTDKDGKELGKLTPDKTVKKADTTPDNGKKALLPTDDYQDTGINLGDTSNLDSISAIDEDGSYVPVYVDNNGNIIVKPGKDVDGPIKVTINKDGKERVIFIDILGHSMGHDDNGYRPGYFDGSYNIPGIRYRDHKTPTHPVTVTVPEKTETGVKVHDTLWYVFHINEFQYEVVRNGVVTKRLMDVTPVLQNGRTMLPLRYVAEALQADVKWDAKTRTATFTKDGLTASIQIDSDEIVLSNGKTVKMDSKPLNINDRILVSVTNVANVFGLTNGNTKDKADQDIEWEQQDKSATIYIRR